MRFLRWLKSQPGQPNADAVLAAVCATLGWGPLMRKRVSRLTVETLPALDAAVRYADRRLGRSGAARAEALLRAR
jgi:hypothetical protein